MAFSFLYTAVALLVLGNSQAYNDWLFQRPAQQETTNELRPTWNEWNQQAQAEPSIMEAAFDNLEPPTVNSHPPKPIDVSSNFALPEPVAIDPGYAMLQSQPIEVAPSLPEIQKPLPPKQQQHRPSYYLHLEHELGNIHAIAIPRPKYPTKRPEGNLL